MISVRVEQSDLNRCLRDVRKWSSQKQAKIYDELVDAANNVHKNAMNAAPTTIIQGLKGAIRPRFYPTQIKTDVVAAKEYAPYVEFGTGTLVDVPEGLEDYAMQFKGQGIRQVNLPARPYLFPAFFKEQKELLKRLKTLFKK
jgi:hypothetical protein